MVFKGKILQGGYLKVSDCMKKVKTKILVLMNSYGGESRLTNLFILNLDKERFEAKVCYLKGKSEVPDTLDKAGLSLYLMSKRGKPDFNTVTKLGKVLKDFRPDIIHCHRFDATLVGLLASMFYGVGKVVSHVHGLNRIRGIRRKLIARVLFKKLAKTICVSNTVKGHMVETSSYFNENNVTVLHNAVDANLVSYGDKKKSKAIEELGISTDTFNMVNVGRLVPTKGQSYLIDAFAEACKENSRLRLYFIGDGRLKDELKAQAHSLGVGDKVNFLGFRKDILDLLCAFDLFVFSSVNEGLPLSIIEAMAAELPVLTTSAGGIPEVFGKGGFGEMVDTKDSIALKRGILKLSSLDNEILRGLGKNARQKVVDCFSAESINSNLEKIYTEIMGGSNER